MLLIYEQPSFHIDFRCELIITDMLLIYEQQSFHIDFRCE